MIDSDKIIAEEYKWVIDNEPTFNISGNTLTGKVGRAPNGDSITITINIPQYYPIVRPSICVNNRIRHPNIGEDGELSLQLLDEWDPIFRLKDVITTTRRLFIKSKQSIKQLSSTVTTLTNGSNRLESEIQGLQKEIGLLNRKITEQKSKRLDQTTTQQSSLEVDNKLILFANQNALKDLLELLVDKFEEAEIDQTDFFRLYRKYIKQQYITEKELNNKEEFTNDIPKEKTKRPISH